MGWVVLSYHIIPFTYNLWRLTTLDMPMRLYCWQRFSVLPLRAQEHHSRSCIVYFDFWTQGSFDERLQSHLGEQIRSDPTHVYGEGFRAAHEAFQHLGGDLPGVLEAVKRTGALPAL